MELVQAKEATRSAMSRLTAIQNDLFELQQKLGQTKKQNEDLENELRERERNPKR